jgi:hypothetical protein
VPAISPQAPASEEQAIDPPREPHGEATHARRQRLGAICFYDEVEVIALDGVVNDSKAFAVGGAQRAEHGRGDELTAQTAQTSTQRDVHWMRGTVRWSRSMRRVAKSERKTLSTCSRARTTTLSSLWK